MWEVVVLKVWESGTEFSVIALAQLQNRRRSAKQGRTGRYSFEL